METGIEVFIPCFRMGCRHPITWAITIYGTEAVGYGEKDTLVAWTFIHIILQGFIYLEGKKWEAQRE